MSFAPHTEIHLLNVPIDRLAKNQCDFPNREAQTSYMLSKHVRSFTDFNYTRKDPAPAFVSVGVNIDELYNANYIMYKNNNFSDRYFYGFITSMEMKAERTTYIYFSPDPWQNWQFDVSISPSFVAREMIQNDIPGANTLLEQLEYGDYVSEGVVGQTPSGVNANYMYVPNLCVIVSSTVDLDDANFPNINTSNSYGGMYSGTCLFRYKYNEIGLLTHTLNLLSSAGKIDAVQNIYGYPAELVSDPPSGVGHKVGPTTPKYFKFPFNNFRLGNELVGYYTPKNKKLLTYPYTLFLVTNNAGSAAEYRYEYLAPYNGEYQFSVLYDCTQASPIIVRPINYKAGNQNDHAMATPTPPNCSWNSNTYANWLAQNNASLNANFTNTEATRRHQASNELYSAGQSAAQLLSLDIGGSISTSLNTMKSLGDIQQNYENTIRSLNAQKTDASVIPDQARGQLTSNSAQLKGFYTFSCYRTCIKPEYAKRIDDYFDMFGYATNEVKTPNINTRPYWNYIQTVNINITGAIPTDELSQIKMMFDNGVTIWHNPDNIGNYNLNNH